MSPDDDAFVRSLVAYDEALAAGRTVEQTPAVGAAADCLRLLARVFGAAPTPTRPTLTLGRFRLVRELGRGAFGVVHLAEDPLLRRQVALKVPHAAHLLTPELRQRFLREARLAAGLDHPHIVRVHEAGEDGGVCYIAAEYCPGTTLAQRLAEAPLPANEAARLVAALAGAVQHAHDKGVVHRDLKPANILLASGVASAPRVRASESSIPRGADATPLAKSIPRGADATPLAKVADFGLAKDLAADATLQTVSGTLVGTPSYMAPEQAEGRTADVGAAADVWALGALLYECLVGRPPFRGATALQTLEQVRIQEPVAPNRLVAGLPRDLNTICLKCLEKDSARRYLSAGALADDLGRFLKGEPIAARAAGPIDRAAKWARRHPTAAALSAVSLLALAVVLVGGVAFTVQLSRALTRVEQQKEIADDALRRAADNDYAMRVALASREVRDGHASRALELLDAAAVESRGWEFFHLRGLALGGGRTVPLIGHEGDAWNATFRSDGLVQTHSKDGTTRLWHRDGREHSRAAPPPDHVASPDGRAFARGDGQTLTLGDATTGQVRRTWQPHKGGFNSHTFDLESRVLATAGEDGVVGLWDAVTGRARGTLRGHLGPVSCVAFRPGAGEVATAGYDGTLRLWDAASGRERLQVPGGTAGIAAIAFSPDGRRLTTLDENDRCRLWAIAGDRVQTLFDVASNGAYRAAFSPDGQGVVLSRGGPVVTLLDVRHPSDRLVLRGHRGKVRGLAFFPDHRRLVTGSYDGGLKVWDARTGHELLSWQGHANEVMGVAVGDGGRLLASASHDATAKVWDADTGRLRHTLVGHARKIQNLAFFPDGRRLATAAGDGTVRLWDAESGAALRVFGPEAGGVWCVAVSPDGRRLACGHYDGVVRLWDVDDESAPPRVLDSIDRDGFTEVAFSPDGRRLAVCGGEMQRVYIWDLESGERVLALKGIDANCWHAAFSPDGRRLATACQDGTVKVWDAEFGRELLHLARHDGPAWRVAFSRDGRLLASCGVDGVVQVWDTASGPEVLTTRHYGEAISAVAAAPGGTWLAVGTHKQIVQAERPTGRAAASDVGLWDVAARREVRRVTCRLTYPRVAFTEDGRRLFATDGKDGVQAWDVATGEEIADPGSPPVIANPVAALLPELGLRAAATRRQVLLFPAETSEELLAERRARAALDPAWHAVQAEDAERAGERFAAAFHWRQVLAARPDDATAKRRLEARKD